MERGLIQVYTGNGKGKTTAAWGLSLRAAGAGLRVFFLQFVKGQEYSELRMLRSLDEIEFQRFGRGSFIRSSPEAEDIRLARRGLSEAEQRLSSGCYDLVVLDEGNIAVYYELFTAEELLDVLQKRAKGTEVVITGRNADKRLVDAADLVTEMREVKHYYTEGVRARRGIEN